MPNQIIKFIALLLFIGCSTNSSEKKESPDVEIEDTVFESANNTGGDSAVVIKSAPLIWSADFEKSTNSYKIHKPADSRLDTMSAEKLVTLINTDWDSIHIELLKTSHDTVYVKIGNSDYLTQRIGSTGAENFMATATFSLTEVKGIKYVNYDFTEGDHASPGVYSRNDFKNFIK